MRYRTGFVVFPDQPETSLLDDVCPFEAPRLIPHPSGRPWVVGSWEADEVRQAAAGPVRVVVIGVCPVTTARLTELCLRVRTLSDVDALARELPGSHHLLAAVDGSVRVQGSHSGLRQVFHTRLGDLTVAADRADALASMTGAGVDERTLAARVVCGGMLPPPLADRSLWSGVATVPHDHCLVLEPHRAREERWWQAPEPALSLPEGAAKLRTALVTAVDGRQTNGEPLGADLSGGMDSTSLCFLAARHTPDLSTFRWAEADAGNDDTYFAAEAARSLPGAHHLVVGQHELPPVFADPQAPADTERPYLYTRTLKRMRYSAHLLSEHGVRWHLAGHGADELFSRFPGYLHRLARRRPLTAVRHLRGHRALQRWPWTETLTQLVRGGGVPGWWDAQADRLTQPPPSRRAPSLGWGLTALRAPVWATGQAVDAARQALRETAEYAEPFARDRGQHQFLAALRTTAPAYRQLSRLFETAGVRLHLPYLDDRVVEAALAVRLHERVTPWRYKPLLAASMRGLVPDVVLNRTTKGDFSADLRAGRRRNLSALLDVFSDSLLADMGMIDVDALRSHLLTPHADSSRDIGVEQLLGCETWVRVARQLPVHRGRQ
ncbi:asparagine synthase-related protein [Streptomyces botrytidirepellens]|uniref:asparagine synthase (glutamine-hydrolyzing) n=1 Tax=Streptomyces botrytidirepellens TaxID=2486417 RepID=A0A3M8SN60_9ACTN|nr:asparagine synthase-related protein [Streptomyces botrytidirepellens]RNF82771.1 asparagine synthase [Streptomyces botrytidirepellens]